uniref:Uncharacterized protein n=1 Tax=Musa acuminata subsp. malaccensis TaxID=214687 RepID=A0A804JPD4_MUSAM
MISMDSHGFFILLVISVRSNSLFLFATQHLSNM